MKKRRATFTLDEATEAALRRAAERLGKAKSEVVREAIQDYDARLGRLSEAERLRMLATFDELVPRIPERPLQEVEAELREIRGNRNRALPRHQVGTISQPGNSPISVS